MKNLSSSHSPKRTVLGSAKAVHDSKKTATIGWCTDNFYLKYLISLSLILCYFFLPKIGFDTTVPCVFPQGIVGHLLFPLSHANIFHLFCNLICIWQIHNLARYIIPATVIGFLCSFLPESLPDIMGCSGIIFAIIGLKYGIRGMGMRMVKYNAIFFVITAFIPNVAVLYHLYCLSVAYFIGYIFETYRLWKKAACI